MAAIEQIRRFNRTVTRRIGVLEDKYLGRDRPLGEARVLFEIGCDGIGIRHLRQRLDLDSGYASRLLRSLEAQGLAETVSAPHDARVRFARLTPAGRAEYDELDRRSDAVAQGLLSPLDTGQRERLIAAMGEIEALLLATDVTIRPEPADSAAAQKCLRHYLDLLNERFEDGYDPASAAPADPQNFAPPAGVFLVAWRDGEPVGCGALRGVGPGLGEIKRLWVDHSVRRIGLGRRILMALEDEACKLGLNALRLDTNKALTEAEALYRKYGYREVPPFNDDPYPDHWFEKELG